jgi:hypothetical protein
MKDTLLNPEKSILNLTEVFHHQMRVDYQEKHKLQLGIRDLNSSITTKMNYKTLVKANWN